MKRLTWMAANGTLILLAACGGSSDGGDSGDAGDDPATAAGGTTVVLKDIAFKPGKLSVKAGDTVTWKFEDRGIAHNVVSDDDAFKSDLKDSGTFQHTFSKPGTFSYTCTVHPGMKGSITVT